jgi:hypothetical protein
VPEAFGLSTFFGTKIVAIFVKFPFWELGLEEMLGELFLSRGREALILGTLHFVWRVLLSGWL